MRAFRVDKLTYAALEATLLEYLAGRADETVPVRRMLALDVETIEDRARGLAERLVAQGWDVSLVSGSSAVGGGSAPGLALPTVLVAIERGASPPTRLEVPAPRARPPVIARIVDDRVVLDLRTVPEDTVDAGGDSEDRARGLDRAAHLAAHFPDAPDQAHRRAALEPFPVGVRRLRRPSRSIAYTASLPAGTRSKYAASRVGLQVAIEVRGREVLEDVVHPGGVPHRDRRSARRRRARAAVGASTSMGAGYGCGGVVVRVDEGQQVAVGPHRPLEDGARALLVPRHIVGAAGHEQHRRADAASGPPRPRSPPACPTGQSPWRP
jgi:hypothetical protein